MANSREVKDPFTGRVVEISNDIVNRLRGKYACGPTLPNGEPEFGWRQMGDPSPIDLEAAAEIERLRARNETLEAALKPLLPAYEAFTTSFRNFNVTGDTQADQYASEREREATALEEAVDVLASELKFEHLNAIRAALNPEKQP